MIYHYTVVHTEQGHEVVQQGTQAVVARCAQKDTALRAAASLNECAVLPPVERTAAVEMEKAWRDGFQSARNCLSEDEAFCLTDDVEEDAWRDSDTRNATAVDAGDVRDE